jgi:hypothetical protein
MFKVTRNIKVLHKETTTVSKPTAFYCALILYLFNDHLSSVQVI